MTAVFDGIPESVFRVFAFATIAILFAMLALPLYFMATTSFKFEAEIYSELTWIPRNPTLSNFRDAIVNFRIPTYLRNTLIVALSTTAIVVVISVLAAYALTRLRFIGRATMARGVLFVYLIPSSLMLIPMYLIIIKMGLKDSFPGLIIANMSFSVPFCTWLMMGYLRSISREIEEASLIDGCTRMLSLWRHQYGCYSSSRGKRPILSLLRPGRGQKSNTASLASGRRSSAAGVTRKHAIFMLIRPGPRCVRAAALAASKRRGK